MMGEAVKGIRPPLIRGFNIVPNPLMQLPPAFEQQGLIYGFSDNGIIKGKNAGLQHTPVPPLQAGLNILGQLLWCPQVQTFKQMLLNGFSHPRRHLQQLTQSAGQAINLTQNQSLKTVWQG